VFCEEILCVESSFSQRPNRVFETDRLNAAAW
jgi:hypothetical protein